MDTFNDISRRATIAWEAQSLVESEGKIAANLIVHGQDAGHLALLMDRVGDVAAAVWRGHTDLEDELLRLSATAQAWVERLQREKMR